MLRFTGPGETKRAPAKTLVSIEDVGMATAVLATDYATTDH